MWSEYTLKIWNLSWTGCPWSLRRVIRWTSLFLPSKKNEHYCPTPYSATARDVNKSSQLHFQGKNNHSNSAPPLTKGHISGKLHFTTLNYTPDYTLHPKLFECTLCTLNYYICYTLHPDVNFIVMLDGNLEYMTYTCALLKWHKVKRPKSPLSN